MMRLISHSEEKLPPSEWSWESLHITELNVRYREYFYYLDYLISINEINN